MPFAAPTNLDEEEKKKQQGGGVNVSGTSTSFATNVPGQEQSSGQANKQRSSGQYANIQSYLDANKTQADGMGQRIAGDVSNKAEDAKSKIQSFESQAPTVQSYDPNAAIQKATSLTDDEKNQYKTYKQTGGYSGPDSLEKAQGYQETVKSANEAHQGVKNAGSETGQQQLLKQTYARPKYTAGENRLDQVLLQNSSGSKAALENLSNKYAGLDQMLSGATSKVGQAINQAQTQALANKQQFAPAEQAAVKSLMDPIKQRAAQMNIDNPALQKRLQEDLMDNAINEETLKALGVTEGSRIFGLNLKDYMNYDQTSVNEDMAANADERAKYTALASLFDDPTMSAISATGKQYTPYNFNKSKFDSDLEAANKWFADYSKNANMQANASGNKSIYEMGGQHAGDYLGLINGNATGNMTVEQYLNQAAPSLSYNHNFVGDEYQGGQRMDPFGNGRINYWNNANQELQSNLSEQVRSNLYQQILNALEQSGYNNTIKVNKG